MLLGCVFHAHEINIAGNALIYRAVPAIPTGVTARFGIKNTPSVPLEWPFCACQPLQPLMALPMELF